MHGQTLSDGNGKVLEVEWQESSEAEVQNPGSCARLESTPFDNQMAK